MLLYLLDVLIFAACVGFLYGDGLWGNTLRLINVVIAGLLAMNFFEPLAGALAGMMPSFTYFCDFIAIWGLFTLFVLLLSLITNKISNVKVKFMVLVDRIGSGVMAAWIGWFMICFTMTTLNVAPLSKEPFNGAFVTERRAASSLSPEMLWLGFTQQASLGAFSRDVTFDPDGDFLLRYAKRRAKLEDHVREKGALRILPEDLRNHY